MDNITRIIVGQKMARMGRNAAQNGLIELGQKTLNNKAKKYSDEAKTATDLVSDFCGKQGLVCDDLPGNSNQRLLVNLVIRRDSSGQPFPKCVRPLVSTLINTTIGELRQLAAKGGRTVKASDGDSELVFKAKTNVKTGLVTATAEKICQLVIDYVSIKLCVPVSADSMKPVEVLPKVDEPQHREPKQEEPSVIVNLTNDLKGILADMKAGN